MSTRPAVAPVFLRLALGLTFLWAGLGKIVTRFDVGAEEVAALQGHGVTVEGAAKVPAASEGVASEAPTGVASAATGGSVQRLHGITLMLHRGAEAGKRADGTASMPLVPVWAAQGKTPMLLAWGAAVAEVGAGMLVLAGLFTRLGAVMLAGVIATAIWLTEIGPAVQSGTAVLGFLPNRATFDVAEWRTLMWQFGLLMSAMALAALGSGTLALDRALFPARAGGPAKAAGNGDAGAV